MDWKQQAGSLILVLNQQTLDAGACPRSKATAEGTVKGKVPTGKPKGERQQREKQEQKATAKGNSKGQQQKADRTGKGGMYTCTGQGVFCQVAAGQAGCPEAPPAA